MVTEYEVSNNTFTLPQSAIVEGCQWLTFPIIEAVAYVKTLPFFSWMETIQQPIDFKDVAFQAFYHSVTLPKLIGIMVSRLSNRQGEFYEILCGHAYEESTHHLLLVEWMISCNLISDKSELLAVLPSLQTRNCINIAYEIAFEYDVETWLAVMNSAIELCFYEYFKVLAPKMRAIGAGHQYFDVHVEADDEHSTIGLKFLAHILPDSAEAKVLTRKALDAISLWASMVHSWIGMNCNIHFGMTGKPTDIEFEGVC